MISNYRKSNFFYSLIALAFSLLLFFNANSQKVMTSLTTPESYEETVENVPIQILYDSEKYYIHGFETIGTVKLSSANRIQLNAEANPDTRSFRLSADLRKLGVGTHEVVLTAKNLSTAVTASIEPKTITVTIENRVTKEFEVNPVIPSKTTPSGFEIDTPTVSPKKVTITTGDKTLEEIKQVVAVVDPSLITDEDFSAEVAVQALDTNGDQLSIQSDPEKVKVTAEVLVDTKEVDLYAEQVGTKDNSVSNFDFHFLKTTVTLTGSRESLSEISKIAIPVDVTGITRTTTNTYQIPVPEGVTANPKVVDVRITPILSNRSTTDTTEQGNDTESEPASSEGKTEQDTDETTSENPTNNGQDNESEKNDQKDNVDSNANGKDEVDPDSANG